MGNGVSSFIFCLFAFWRVCWRALHFGEIIKTVSGRLVQCGHDWRINLFLSQQELFHGPTFAFMDVALQMLGNFFEYFLETGSNGGRLAVLGATSGVYQGGVPSRSYCREPLSQYGHLREQ
jgi:hypothetical protein